VTGASLFSARVDWKVVLRRDSISLDFGLDMVIPVGRAKDCPESFGPVELSKDCIDSGEAHHIKRLFLVKEGHRSFLVLSVDHIYDHLHIVDIFSTIPPRDKSPLVVANFPC
jgi:hypothetical protein